MTLLFLASGEKRVPLDRPHRIVIFIFVPVGIVLVFAVGGYVLMQKASGLPNHLAPAVSPRLWLASILTGIVRVTIDDRDEKRND